MGFLILPEPSVLLPDKQGQIVFIDPFLLVKIIFPDKTSLIPILGNGLLSQNFTILVNRIQVKNNTPPGSR